MTVAVEHVVPTHRKIENKKNSKTVASTPPE
jgi:hypothetical protein